jgi:uncharacterized membrane protein YraQ (UPF0718 family)
MSQISNAFTLFLSLLVEAVPFLLLGVILSSLLLLFVDERKLIASLPKHPFLGALSGSLFGFMFPVCECGNVPVARRLIAQGAPASVAVGFLLAAPTINPVVIWATWVAFRDQPEIVVLRVVLSLIVATTIGWVFSAQADIRPLLQPALCRTMPNAANTANLSDLSTSSLTPDPLANVSDKGGKGSKLLQTGTFILGEPNQPLDLGMLSVDAASIRHKPWDDRLRLFVENTIGELRELGGVLVLGSAIAAIIQVGVPREIIINLGQGPITSIIAMMVLAAVVSICSTVDAFLRSRLHLRLPVDRCWHFWYLVLRSISRRSA